MELPDILLLAKLSNVVYGDLPGSLESNVAALGMTLVGSYDDESQCRALVADWAGKRVLAFSGTHFATNTRIAEIFDNVDSASMSVPGGNVPAGYYVPMARAWLALSHAFDDRPLIITGHSMGGVRAHQAGSYWHTAKVVSFGAPKGGDEGFWRSTYPGDNQPLRVVHERDFAPDWPLLGPWTQPSPMFWLHDGDMTITDDRGTFNDSVADHSVDKYIAALDALNKATALRID